MLLGPLVVPAFLLSSGNVPMMKTEEEKEERGGIEAAKKNEKNLTT